MFTLASILGTNLFTQLFKKASAKFGDTGVHIIVLVLSVASTIIWGYYQTNPSVKSLIDHALIIGSASIATYQVIWKQIGKNVSP